MPKRKTSPKKKTSRKKIGTTNKGVPVTSSKPTMADYELGRHLGAGNYGTVWEARHKHLRDRRFAVKILEGTTVGIVAKDEANKQARVGHVNVVKVEHVTNATVDGRRRTAIVLEFCDHNLSKFFEQNRTPRKGVPYKKAEPVLKKILRGIKFAHSQGFVHGDLKPANILMIGDVPKIADFGAARSLREKFSYVRGSGNWMAREVLTRQSDVDKESDYFSFGAIAYMILSGRHPFFSNDPSCLTSEEDNIKCSRFRLKPLDKKLSPGTPPKVCGLIMQLLVRGDDIAEAKARREQAIRELQRFWSAAAAASGVPAKARRGASPPPKSGAKSVARPKPRPKTPTAAVALPSPAEETAIAKAYAAARKRFFVNRNPDAAIDTLEAFLASLGWERLRGSGSRSIADCWSLLAFIHNSRVGGIEFEKAEKAASHGLEVSDNHLESYQTRGWTRLQTRNVSGAVADLERALALATDPKRSQQIKGQLERARSLQV